ncbi:YqgU-like beta propeller domain-containing protein [Sporosarcina sp. CAU 1771]
MRRLLYFLIVTLLLMGGCVAKTEDVEEPIQPLEPIEENPIKEEVELKTLQTNTSKFHFVADWLSDFEVLFVEKESNFYYVKSFNLETGKIEIIHKDISIIADVLIHPSKEYILLHTTDNPTSAVLKILSLDGTIHHEITLESSELAIEWNDLDPSLVLLTAFHQDWSFDVFLYNPDEEVLKLIESGDPFPKWYGTDRIVINLFEGHPLDGSTLMLLNMNTGEEEITDLTNIVYLDTYGNSLLTVKVDGEQKAIYTLIDVEGNPTVEWFNPAVSNYSEWIFPEFSWISEDKLFMSSPDEGGQLDELTSPYRLFHIVDGEKKVVADVGLSTFLRCSPEGTKCLTGDFGENLIDIPLGEKNRWIHFDE